MGWGEILSSILNNVYFHAFIILVGSILLARIVLWIFRHVIEKFVKQTPSKYDDKFVAKLEDPFVFLIVLVGAQLALKKIVFSENIFLNTVNSLMIVVITYMFVGISTVIISKWAEVLKKDHNKEFHEEIIPLLKSLTKVVLIAICVILILQIWGVEVGALLASVGVIGLILGLAFRETLTNIFGGISLIMDGSIHKKDVIQLDTGELGEVMEVNLRSTKIRTFDDDYLIVPNGLFANSKFTNLAQPTETLRITIPINVAYGSDIEKVREVLLNSLKGRTDILKFPKREVRFIEMADYSLKLDLIFFISDYKEMFRMKNDITTLAYNALNEANINIPFPTRTLYIDKSKPTSKKKKYVSKVVVKTVPEVNKSSNVIKKKKK